MTKVTKEVRTTFRFANFNTQIAFLFLLPFFSLPPLFSQSVQLQYDLRHSLDPKNNKSNYPTLFYEFFKTLDNGTFFVKTESDFYGENNNVGQLYFQIFREFKFWAPLVFIHVEYNGGLGIAECTQYGYYINNAFLLGGQYPFQWENDWQSMSLCYRYNVFTKPSHDLQLSLYWGKNFWRDDFRFSGNFVLFTQNKNTGDDLTVHLSGKKILFWGQPQIWYNVTKTFSIGTQITMYYHIYSYSENMLFYPTVAIKFQF